MPSPQPRDIAAAKEALKSLDIAVRTLVSRAEGSSSSHYDNLNIEEIADEVQRLCGVVSEFVKSHRPWLDTRGQRVVESADYGGLTAQEYHYRKEHGISPYGPVPLSAEIAQVPRPGSGLAAVEQAYQALARP